jgi:hypothetical protein
MVQPKANETASDSETARLRAMTADWDDESQRCWEKLVELALNAPGSIVHIAQQRAPEVAARVAKMSETT